MMEKNPNYPQQLRRRVFCLNELRAPPPPPPSPPPPPPPSPPPPPPPSPPPPHLLAVNLDVGIVALSSANQKRVALLVA